MNYLTNLTASSLAFQQALNLRLNLSAVPKISASSVPTERPTWGTSRKFNSASSNAVVSAYESIRESPRPANHHSSTSGVGTSSGSSCTGSENESECSSPSKEVESKEKPFHPPSPPSYTGNKEDRGGNYKKARTSFTNFQIQKLELKFNQQKYLTRKDRTSLAHALGLTEKHVKTWFQNRRTKWKKECSEENWSKHKEMAATIMYMQHIEKKNS